MAHIFRGVILIFSLLLAESLATIIPLIYGGQKLVENPFQFLVSLRIKEKDGFRHNCGASIISDRFLLTAAHCTTRGDPNIYHVSVGVNRREDQGDVYTIKKLIAHPSYNESKGLENDIALIVLEKPIKFTANISAIDIERDFVEENETVIVAGWGLNEDGYSGLKHLREVTISNDECQKQLRMRINNTTLCARSYIKGEGVGSMDSGGPLFTKSQSNTFKQVGVVSWGALGIIDGYARVSEFIGWIDMVMQEM